MPSGYVRDLEHFAAVHVYKFIIVTDHDIESGVEGVVWARPPRGPNRDVLIVENTPIDYLDFAAGRGARIEMGIDAPTNGRKTPRVWAADRDAVRCENRVDRSGRTLGL